MNFSSGPRTSSIVSRFKVPDVSNSQQLNPTANRIVYRFRGELTVKGHICTNMLQPTPKKIHPTDLSIATVHRFYIIHEKNLSIIQYI